MITAVITLVAFWIGGAVGFWTCAALSVAKKHDADREAVAVALLFEESD